MDGKTWTKSKGQESKVHGNKTKTKYDVVEDNDRPYTEGPLSKKKI